MFFPIAEYAKGCSHSETLPYPLLDVIDLLLKARIPGKAGLLARENIAQPQIYRRMVQVSAACTGFNQDKSNDFQKINQRQRGF